MSVVGTADVLRRRVRSMVSVDFQRKVVTLCAAIVGFGAYELVATLYKLGPLGGGVAAALTVFKYYAQVDKRNPRTALLLGRFAEYLAAGTVRSQLPIIASLIAFAIGVAFKASNKDAGMAAAVVGAVVWWLSFKEPIPTVANKLVRGRAQPIDLAESKAAEFELPKGDPGITWGGLRVPSKMATSHFMVVGTTGSGKTLTLRLLMQEVLKPIGSGEDHRALIYDAKQDIISQLPGMGIPGNVFTLNPFDERCLAWDVAKDITEPTAALQAAATLIPSEKNSSQPFFVDSAQLLLYGVMLSFIRTNADWRFSDLIKTMHTVERLRRVLDRCPETQHIMGRFEHNRETLDEVMATVATKLTPYEAIAAMWDKAHDAGRKISLNEWVSDRKRQNCVLILGNNERARAAMDRINQVVFKRVSELLLDLKEDRTDKRRNWVFLDELADAGKLDGLPALLTKGRSKGVCVVLGFQDIDSLKEVYGDNVAGALTSQCNCKAILRLESPSTGEWASKLFGEYEAIEIRTSESFSSTSGGSGGRSSGGGGGHFNWNTSSGENWSSSRSLTFSEEYAKRQSVMESQLYTIPPTTEATGLTGYYLVPGIGPYRHTYPGSWLFKGGLAKIADFVDDVLLRASWQQWLRMWDESDAVRRRLVNPLPPETPQPTAEELARAQAEAQSQAEAQAQTGEPAQEKEEEPLEEPRLATPEETQKVVQAFKGFSARQKR